MDTISSKESLSKVNNPENMLLFCLYKRNLSIFSLTSNETAIKITDTTLWKSQFRNLSSCQRPPRCNDYLWIEITPQTACRIQIKLLTKLLTTHFKGSASWYTAPSPQWHVNALQQSMPSCQGQGSKLRLLPPQTSGSDRIYSRKRSRSPLRNSL